MGAIFLHHMGDQGMLQNHAILTAAAFAAFLLPAACDLAFAAEKVDKKGAAGEKVIVAFGDSTTAVRDGVVVYATLLQTELASKPASVRVFNAGVPGNSTADAMRRFQKTVVDQKPNIVILQFGINDASVEVWRSPPAAAPRVPRDVYEKNLTHFVRELKKQSAEVVLMTPNPCRWTEMLKGLYGKPPYQPEDPDGFNVLLKEYAETVRNVAQREKVTLVDVYQAFDAHGKEPGQSVDDLLLDGMHPNSKGHALVAKLLFASPPLAKLAH